MVSIGDLLLSLWLTGALFLISLVVFGVCFAAFRFIANTTLAQNERARALAQRGAGAGLPLAATGIIAGFLTGASREAAVDALVPAVLTLAGGVVVYLIGRGRIRGPVVGFVLMMFSLNVMLGVGLGSKAREKHEELSESLVALKAEANRELGIQQYRKSLNLPPLAAKEAAKQDEP